MSTVFFLRIFSWRRRAHRLKIGATHHRDVVHCGISLHSLIVVGVEGIAVAAAVLLLVGIVVPAIYRQRTVVAEAPRDERYAPDLRMIHERTYEQTSDSEYRCTIFPTERVMDKKKQPVNTRRGQGHTSQLRTLARARSHAKARIAARQAARIRYGIGAVAIAAITAILWVLVGSVHAPLTVAIVLSVVLGAYLAGYGYLVRLWNREDRVDIEKLTVVQGKLDVLKRGKKAPLKRPVPSATNRDGRQHSARTAPMSGTRRAGNRGANQEAEQESAQQQSAALPVHSEKAVATDEVAALGQRVRHVAPAVASAHAPKDTELAAERQLAAHGERSGSAARPAPAAPPTTAEVAPLSAQPAVPQKISLPSYTLKPHRSSRPLVKPYVAPPAAEAPVPYRPHEVGERIGDSLPEAPHAVPEAIADQPERHQRTHVLGVGATLDSLLDRRRA